MNWVTEILILPDHQRDLERVTKHQGALAPALNT